MFQVLTWLLSNTRRSHGDVPEGSTRFVIATILQQGCSQILVCLCPPRMIQNIGPKAVYGVALSLIELAAPSLELMICP